MRRAVGLSVIFCDLFTDPQTLVGCHDRPVRVPLLFGAGIGIGYAASLFNNVKVPKTEELVQQVRNVSSVSKLTYSDKSLIAEVDSDLIRTPVAGDAISDNVKKAVIATEDENFESHKGLYLKPFFGRHLDL